MEKEMNSVENSLIEVIQFRCGKLFNSILKDAYKKELDNLLNVNMDIVHEEVKIPEREELLDLPQIPPPLMDKIPGILQEYEDTLEAVDYL